MFLPSNVSANVLATPPSSDSSPSGLLFSVEETVTTYDYEKTFALITSMIVCNKTEGDVGIFAKIENGEDSAAHILYNLSLPPGVSFDIIQGNKFTLKEGDSLRVWHNSLTEDAVDLVLSYTLHRPLTTYDI